MKKTGIDRLLDDHEKRLKQLEDGLPFHPDPPSGRGRGSRAWTWITNHKATSIALPIILCVVGIYGKYYLDHKDDGTVAIADKEISKNVTPLLSDLDRKVTETQTTLKTLQPFIEDLVRREMDGAAASPSAELRKRLPRIRDVVSVARVEGIAVDQRVVVRLATTLFEVASTSKSDGSKLAWNVANQVLGYYSSLIKIEKSGYVMRAQDKNDECMSAGGATGISMRDATFEHCTQHLDSLFGPTAKERGLFFQGNVFRDVRVIYSGGPLDLNEVYFVNCTFEMEPGPRSKTLGETLLASAPVTLQLH